MWVVQLVRVVVVIALLCIAAVVATPKGRLLVLAAIVIALGVNI